MPKWEYYTLFLKADARREEEFLQSIASWKDGIPLYTPESLIPGLNTLGAEGWELVHMEPVVVGNKGDVLVQGIRAVVADPGHHSIFAFSSAL